MDALIQFEETMNDIDMVRRRAESVRAELDKDVVRAKDVCSVARGRLSELESDARYDLQLLMSLNDVSGIPTVGKKLVIVAVVDRMLHFRIFDSDGKAVVDTDEKRLAEQARQIEDLRKQLESLWPPGDVTTSKEARVIEAVALIVGYTPDPVLHDQLEKARQDLASKEAELSRVQEELKPWQKQYPRLTAIAYCTAFETFLRNYLVERCKERPALLDRFLHKRLVQPHVNKICDGMAKHVPFLRRPLDQRFVQVFRATDLASSKQISVDDVDACIERLQESFQNIREDGTVNSLYRDVLGWRPFEWHENGGFSTNAEWESCYLDVRLLFCVRHNVVHRDGNRGEGYESDVEELCSGEGNYRPHPTLQGENGVPLPDDILKGTKLEEFYESLFKYARYVIMVCEVDPTEATLEPCWITFAGIPR